MAQRKTSQRQAVQAVFESAGRPLTVAEAHESAQQSVESIGTATVYRAINALVDEGFLVPVQVPGEPDRYELAGLAHHHHFHCTGCGKVFDVEGCPGAMKNLCPPGFELTGHEVMLYGRCGECASAA
ncbi:MAG: transcriptional repressor [Planctomycetota bacterium]